MTTQAEVKTETAWQPVDTFDGHDIFDRVDLWLEVRASPMSFGMGDSWRVTDCWRENGKWFHMDRGDKAELRGEYITHWMPLPARPDGGEYRG